MTDNGIIGLAVAVLLGLAIGLGCGFQIGQRSLLHKIDAPYEVTP